MKKLPAFLFALLAIPILLLGYNYTPNGNTMAKLSSLFNVSTPASSSNTNHPIKTPTTYLKNLYVPASSAPFDTGINLKKWQVVTITATGEANSCKIPTDGAYKNAGPMGWPYIPPNENKVGPLPKEYPFMALAYRIGNAKLNSQDWKFAGNYQEFEVQNSGKLFLVANDKFKDEKGKSPKNWWADNTGGFDVTIKIVDPTIDCKNNKDISKLYAICNGRIFNKITQTIFSTAQEFLTDSGCSDFSHLVYEQVTKLPDGLSLVNGKKLTKEEKTKIETTDLEGKPIRKK